MIGRFPLGMQIAAELRRREEEAVLAERRAKEKRAERERLAIKYNRGLIEHQEAERQREKERNQEIARQYKLEQERLRKEEETLAKKRVSFQ